ncbi:hypothetical protein [Vibrio sp. D431a]|uniref:hypothetical protein n=1 Tax=Vibrio sp. D431a TaxID=2837388 RepID=UPI002554D4B5|nr:hypothetical protein [Vibrio sp. D431a]MDK9789932.1 hypothetical protein [Vibrio sp. D431a]
MSFYPAFQNNMLGNNLSRYAGTEILFENPWSGEVFEGFVESNRSEEELYVRVPELRDTIQRVYIKNVLAVVKHMDNTKPTARPLMLNDSKDNNLSFFDFDEAREHRQKTSSHYLFLPDGQPVNKLLKDARRESKSNKELKHSTVLNRECLERFNTSYNKLLPKCKKLSPFMYENTLFLPLVFSAKETNLKNDIVIFASVGKKGVVTGAHDCDINLPNGVFFKGESTGIKDIELLHSLSKAPKSDRCNQGWVVQAFVTGKISNPPFLKATKQFDGIYSELSTFTNNSSTTHTDTPPVSVINLSIRESSFHGLSASDLCQKLGINHSHDHTKLITLYGLSVELYSNELSEEHPPHYIVVFEDGTTLFEFTNMPKDLTDLSFEIALRLASK